MRVLAQLLVAAGVAAAAVGCGEDPAQRNPCEATDGPTLREVAADFQLVLPAEATDVRFVTLTGWTAYSLTLVFSTTPDGVTSFLDASELPTPSTVDPKSLAAGRPHCGLAEGFTYSASVREDSTYSNLLRSVAVDNTDAAVSRKR